MAKYDVKICTGSRDFNKGGGAVKGSRHRGWKQWLAFLV